MKTPELKSKSDGPGRSRAMVRLRRLSKRSLQHWMREMKRAEKDLRSGDERNAHESGVWLKGYIQALDDLEKPTAESIHHHPNHETMTTATPKKTSAPQENQGGGWMIRLVRLLCSMLFNAGISGLAWYAVHGNTGAERLLKFVLWTFAVIMLLASLNKVASPKIAAKGRTIPAWLSHGWGVLLICFLVWHGWIGAAIALLIWEIAEAAIFHQPQLDDATEPRSVSE